MANSKNILPAPALMIVAGTLTVQAADVDVNGEGTYNFPEPQAVMPEMTEEVFVTLDVSGDGPCPETEIQAGS